MPVGEMFNLQKHNKTKKYLESSNSASSAELIKHFPVAFLTSCWSLRTSEGACKQSDGKVENNSSPKKGDLCEKWGGKDKGQSKKSRY